MSGILIYAENCPYCRDIIEFVQNNPVLIPMLKTHNINRQGVPKGVSRVPVLITSQGEQHVGIEVLRWMENMIPTTFEGNSTNSGYSFDEPFDGVGDGFPIDSYGMELSPNLTHDLKNKIEKPLNEAYADMKKMHTSNDIQTHR